jgi:hypothetical protein
MYCDGCDNFVSWDEEHQCSHGSKTETKIVCNTKHICNTTTVMTSGKILTGFSSTTEVKYNPIASILTRSKSVVEDQLCMLNNMMSTDNEKVILQERKDLQQLLIDIETQLEMI